jgi:hypothetical protein
MAIASDKFVFLHIPKTGGVWVTYALKQAIQTSMIGQQHSHFPQLLQLYDEDWYKQRYIFTMIRHPITWYQSRWAFRVKHGWRLGHPLDFNCSTNDFHAFVEAVLKHKPDGWLTWLYNQYIENVPGGIDYVARLEKGVGEVKHVLKEAGVEYKDEQVENIPRINDSDMGGHSSKYWAKYTPELFDRVMAVESKIIDRYYSDYEINPNDHVGPRPF